MQNTNYCYIHSFGKFNNIPFYKNSTIHFIAGVVGISLTTIFFVIGPTKSNQTEILKKGEQIEEKLSEIEKEEIERKKDIIGQITGGNSYPRLSIANNYFLITVNGVYSIPECTIEVIYLKDYLNITFNITSNYLENGIKDKNNIISIYRSTYPKLWKNSKHIKIPLPTFVTESIIEDSSSGFDIWFTSAYKRWKQEIRFIKHTNEPDKFGIVDLITEEKPSAEKGDTATTQRILQEISPDFPTMFLETKSKSKQCRIILYNIENQHLKMYQPNFVMELNDKTVKLPTYELRDFKE